MADSETSKTKSERIREFGREGVPVAEIARKLDIRYQHARKVLLEAGLLPGSTRVVNSEKTAKVLTVKKPKPSLHISELLSAGFSFTAKWKLGGSGEVSPDTPLPKEIGVYAFARDDIRCSDGVQHWS